MAGVSKSLVRSKQAGQVGYVTWLESSRTAMAFPTFTRVGCFLPQLHYKDYIQ